MSIRLLALIPVAAAISLALSAAVDAVALPLYGLSVAHTNDRIAREEFGMVRGDKEILYRFGDAPSTSGDKPR